MGSHHIIHTGYGHDALGGTPPPSWGKPVLQKTKDELWDGIQYRDLPQLRPLYSGRYREFGERLPQ